MFTLAMCFLMVMALWFGLTYLVTHIDQIDEQNLVDYKVYDLAELRKAQEAKAAREAA